MNSQLVSIFLTFGSFAVLLFIIGIYCILAGYNLIRALIGVELLIKAVTLFLIVAGFASGHLELAQSLIITMIVIEVVMITIAVGIVVGIYRKTGSLDARNIRNLKG
ncbi:MAG: NADH-quinone oxidoreductase subunit K [Candidatus Omnitrophica bacterium]|nr:NADH-quinone oxidoreductase subunit K [Candidatus Omnitrophota bacterium]